MIVRLIWSPRSLASLAARVSTPRAYLAGCVTLSLLIGCAVSGAMTGGAEPFRDFLDYFQSAILSALIVAVTLGLVFSSVLLVIVANFCVWLTHTPWKKPAAVRIILLSPLCWTLPVIIWSVLAALHYASYSSFGLMSGKPEWIESPLIAVFSSIGWLFPAVLVWLVHCVKSYSTCVELLAKKGPPMCHDCGYNLTGNVSGRCPECGRSIVSTSIAGVRI